MDIGLSLEAKKTIDAYLHTKNPIHYGTESHALADFRNWCVEMYEKPQLVCIRNDARYTVSDRQKAIEHRREYFANEPRFYSMNFEPYHFIDGRTRLGSSKIHTRVACEKYFHNHIGDIATHFCRAKYGSVKTALLKTDTWIELWNEFEEFFEDRRKNFMAKTDETIAKIQGNGKVEVGKKQRPQSVGGVANLLRVLTKTMELQGADIRSIAKMQYAICVQNGLYIPDEFLNDVAVALDIEGKLEDVGA